MKIDDAISKIKNLITGDKVRLTSNLPQDVEVLQSWANDPDFYHQYDGSDFYLMSKTNYAENEKVFDNTWNARYFRIRGRLDKTPNPDRLLGQVVLYNIDWVDRKATLAIKIDPAETGKGYGSDALTLILRYGFQELNLNRISLLVYDYNVRAKALYERMGFVVEGTHRQAMWVNGKYHDNYTMAMLFSDWSKFCLVGSKYGPDFYKTDGVTHFSVSIVNGTVKVTKLNETDGINDNA